MKRVLLIVVLAGVAVSLPFVFYSVLKSQSQSESALLAVPTTSLHQQEKSKYGLPMRLKIPKISVDAAVEYVGLTPQGEMGIPAGPNNVAWYNQGPRPGEKGSSVINGHFGWRDNIPAVFDNLHKLQNGDTLSVEDEKGKTITFVVRELRTFGQNEDASVVFSSSDKKAHLNLITCQGTWNKSQKSYSNRLVVFTDKEPAL